MQNCYKILIFWYFFIRGILKTRIRFISVFITAKQKYYLYRSASIDYEVLCTEYLFTYILSWHSYSSHKLQICIKYNSQILFLIDNFSSSILYDTTISSANIINDYKIVKAYILWYSTCFKLILIKLWYLMILNDRGIILWVKINATLHRVLFGEDI